MYDVTQQRVTKCYYQVKRNNYICIWEIFDSVICGVALFLNTCYMCDIDFKEILLQKSYFLFQL